MAQPSAAGADFPPVPNTPLPVIIVHHDQPERCVATVAAFRTAGPAVTVSVVDNSSSPGATAELRARLPGTDVLATGSNAGFGPGANAGLRRWLAHGEGDWVALAPHDALPADGCLELLLAEAHGRVDAGLICAEFGTMFDYVPAVDWVIGGFYRPAPRSTGWQDVDYPHGTLVLLRRQMLQEIGLFDERYFAYCEEVDLALRARAAGWRVGLVWGALVTNGRLPAQLIADYLQVRNTLLLVREHFGRYPAALRCGLVALGLAGKVRRDPGQARLHVQLEVWAVVDFVRRRFGPPPPAVWAAVGASKPEPRPGQHL